jgi:type VI secretion system protein ImpK
MSTATLPPPPTASAPAKPAGELAFALQEAFTVVVRLRTGRQGTTDAQAFRAHVKQLLAAADQRARAAGYSNDMVKLAVYAYIALLDESVLGSAQPMFAEWSRQSLQEEVFGEHMAGENFFRTLQQMMAQQDSEHLADVLEVYLLCLLLGFRGRYGLSDSGGELQGLTTTLQARIQRIRGTVPTDLVPDWAVPRDERVPTGHDRWLPRLTMIAGGAIVVALVLFLLYSWLLRGSLNELSQII